MLQPYMIPRENFDLKSQRKIFALRTKMNHIKQILSPQKMQKSGVKCYEDMENIHLLKCTRINKKKAIIIITYLMEHYLNKEML